jgi:hypothetical protein
VGRYCCKAKGFAMESHVVCNSCLFPRSTNRTVRLFWHVFACVCMGPFSNIALVGSAAPDEAAAPTLLLFKGTILNSPSKAPITDPPAKPQGSPGPHKNPYAFFPPMYTEYLWTQPLLTLDCCSSPRSF